MKAILYILLFTTLTLNIYAQTNCKDTIVVIKSAGGLFFMQKDVRIKTNQMLNIMRTNLDASYKMARAKDNQTVNTVLGGIGGFIAGWWLGAFITGRNIDWRVPLVGATLVGISIPFGVGYNKNAKKAIELYNRDLCTEKK